MITVEGKTTSLHKVLWVCVGMVAECTRIRMLGVRMPQINTKLVWAIVIGVVLAFCFGLLLFLIRKNPRRAKKIMGEASVDRSESN